MEYRKEIPENTKEIGTFLFSRFKILKGILKNFGIKGWIVEVLTKLLTKLFLTYMSYVTIKYDIFDMYVIYDTCS
jgi:hypothetical protein